MGRMKVLFWTLLVASFIFDEAKADSKTDCQNRVKATAGKLIQECQDEWNEKCVRISNIFGAKIQTFFWHEKLFF